MSWIKEHFLEAIGVVVALFTYFGIEPSSLNISFGLLTPILYVLAGVLIGWGLCRAFHGINLRFRNISDGKRMTIDEFAEDFGSAPYEIKAFLKTVLDKGVAYRRTDDFIAWESYLRYLNSFVTGQTIRNGITKYVMRPEATELFEQNPDLLAAVSDDDVRERAIGGAEGTLPSYFSDRFYWWFYSDDLDAPQAFSTANHIFGANENQ